MAHTNNEQNLKPMRSSEEARENGRKGGIASGQARRKRKEQKEVMEMILNANIPIGKLRDTIKNMNISNDENDLNNQTAMLVGLWKSALNGNINAYDRIVGLTENQQKEIPKIEIKIIDNSHLEKTLFENNDKNKNTEGGE